MEGLDSFLTATEPHPSFVKILEKKEGAEFRLKDLENTLKDTPMPSKGKDENEKKSIKETRKRLRKDIKDQKKEVDKVIIESKDLIDANESQELNNLARDIGYHAIKDYSSLDPIDFEREKGNLLFKASRAYDSKAKLTARMIVHLGAVAEILPYGEGTQGELKLAEPVS